MKSGYSQFIEPDRFAIFLFHGVIPSQRHEVRNYTRKHLLLDQFVTVLRELKQAGNPVSMQQIVEASSGGMALPPSAFAVTFDDGFANNLEVAAPALTDLDIPATFYVTTGFVGQPTRSWTDLVEAALEQSSAFSLKGWGAAFDGRYTSTREKIALMERVRAHVKSDSSVDSNQFSSELARAMLPVEPDFDDWLDKKLDWDQVKELARNALFNVGGHSHTHRTLAFLPDAEMRQEIDESLTLLRSHLPNPIRHYSYPEGLAHCYSDKVIEALREQQIVCSPSAIHGVNRVGDDLFHLRRIFVV